MPKPPREPTAPHYSTLPRDREARLAAGTRVVDGQLEVVDELARGGMAVVYRAIDHSRDGERVALKIVTAGADRVETGERFRNEARLGASLAGHPNIVRPLRVGSLDGPEGFEERMYLVTELVEGDSLDIVMGRHHTGLPVRRACVIARDLARALVGLHERGIVHRDIKPGNVLVTGSGPEENARLIDFGLAYATGDGWESKSPDLTAEGHAPGTPLYMSPQQAAHLRPTPAFDIYSFGVMFYELLSGNPPYEGYALGVMMAHKCDPEAAPYAISKLCPDLPLTIAAIIDRCLLFEPSERPDAKELLAELDVVLGTPRAPVRARRSPRRTIVSVGALVVGLVVAGVIFWPTEPSASRAESAVLPEEPASLESATLANAGREDGPLVEEAETIDQPDPVARPAPTAPEPQAPPEPVEPSPSTTPSRRVPASKGAAPKEAGSEPSPPTCEERRAEAKEAKATKRWAAVLTQTEDAACWSGAKAERKRLRVEALLRLGRVKECARAVAGSTDPIVERWGQECIVELMGRGE